MANIRHGSVVRGPNWPEPVEIKLIEEKGGYVHIVGATTISRTHIDQIIPAAEFQKLVIEEKTIHFSEEPWKVFLGLETIRYRVLLKQVPLLPRRIIRQSWPPLAGGSPRRNLRSHGQ